MPDFLFDNVFLGRLYLMAMNNLQTTLFTNHKRLEGVGALCCLGRVHTELWTARHEAELTRHELAERAALTYVQIRSIELGKRWPTILEALRLAAALDCGVEKLFGLAPSDIRKSSSDIAK